MPNPLYTYIFNIYDLVWLEFKAYNHCRLFNGKHIFIRINRSISYNSVLKSTQFKGKKQCYF